MSALNTTCHKLRGRQLPRASSLDLSRGLKTGLLAYWALDTATGDDKHTGAIALTYSGPGFTTATGKVYANAVSLSPTGGEGDNLAVTDSRLVVTGDWTCACWVKRNDFTAAFGNIINAEDWALSSLQTTGQLRVAGPSNAVAYTPTTLTAATWALLWGFYDRSAGKLYASMGSGVTVESVTCGSSSPLNTGAIQIGEDAGCQQVIGPVALWKRCLSASERAQFYNSGNGLTYASM